MLQQIREMFVKRTATAGQKYLKLVTDTVEGKSIPTNGVDVCIAAGRSVSDLESDVATLAARMQAAADLKRAEAMQADYDRLSAAYTKAAELRDAMVKRHAEELSEANGTLNEAFNERRSIGAQAQQLRDRATAVLLASADPSIAQQIAALEQERHRLREERGTSMQRSPFVPSPSWDRVTTEAKRAEHERETASWLKGINQRETAIAQQIERLQAKRLDPEACVIG